MVEKVQKSSILTKFRFLAFSIAMKSRSQQESCGDGAVKLERKNLISKFGPKLEFFDRSGVVEKVQKSSILAKCRFLAVCVGMKFRSPQEYFGVDRTSFS